ncbi:MAG: T9SS type A sorting domain-containing protein [Bacteroidales bacterium]|nr:T9SS type A sorting domain-containing protein [Bacteroidales bacterium]
MKKLSLLFFASLFVVVANSQITITDNNVYILGDNITYQKLFDVDQTFDVGSAGENITWDFSALTEDGTTETYEYIDPAGLPHATEMPSVDLAERLNSQTNGYFYFDNNGGTEWNRSGWYVYDTNNSIDMWLIYKEVDNWIPQSFSQYPYPFTYLDNMTLSYFASGNATEGSGVDSLSVDNGNYHFECDGYGKLFLPHKVYANALRVHLTESFSIKTYAFGMLFDETIINESSYFWFVEGVKGPVMTFIHNTTNSDQSYNAKWYRENLTQITTDFTVNSQTGNTDDIFQYTNLSEPLNQGSTFLWEFSPNTVTFEGGTDATSAHPQVSFNTPGLYTVTLTTNNNNFAPNSASATKTDYMDISAAPQLVADFTADNTNPNLSGAVNFTNSTVPDASGGTTYTWAVSPGVNGTHWGFTNFTSNTDEDPQITFYQAGCYSIQMIATNNSFSNSPVTVTKINYINAGGGCGNAYTVTFTVTDGTNPINGAQVTVSGYSPVTTNSSGVATIDLYDGNYSFDVTATGYADYSSSFNVSGANLPVDVTMTELSAYTVTFTVTEGSNPVSSAEITVTGESPITTNASGIATINLYDGNYNYNITATGYSDYAGSFTVAGANLPVNVAMTVGIENLTENNIKLYPNPTTGILNVNSDEPLLITIFDISGKQIYASKQPNRLFEIDLSNNSKGLYFINIIKNNKVLTEKIILK